MKKRRLFRIAGSVLAVMMLGTGFWGVKVMSDLNAYKKQVAEIVITAVDLSTISDGVYRGSCDVKMVAAVVDVTVKDHRIAAIDLVSHKNGKGKPAEVILKDVLKQQSLEVDVITGATSSSKVILKAVENALEQRHSKVGS